MKSYNFAGIDVSSFWNKKNILDYGSGDGKFSVYLVKKGFFVTAVDIDLNSKHKILSKLNENEKSRIDKFGNFIMPKSKVFYLRRK